MGRTAHLTAIILLLTISSFAQDVQKSKDLNVNADLIALSGYDPVAYLKDKKAIKGNKNITTKSGGVTYQFSSIANKNIFLATPATYEPQYGGWCAYAMGDTGEKVQVDPETFKIIDGKLYLFYNRFFNNTLESWNQDEATLKVKADKNWIKLSKH
jgi:YHS domain-containing protein